VGMACLPGGAGNDPPGSPCTSPDYPNECASDLCIGGICREPCCRDDQCEPGQVCRALDNGQQLLGRTRTGLVRVCVTP
jgi:hypothetical protein